MALVPCSLYEVDLRIFRPNSGVDCDSFIQAMTDLSHGAVTRARLCLLSRNARNKLYVLADPSTIPDNGAPKIYCAIQTHLEGYCWGFQDTLEGVPRKEMKSVLRYYPDLVDMVGANIAQFYAVQGYADAALEQFKRCCNNNLQPAPAPAVFGAVLRQPLRPNNGALHYFGIFIDPILFEFNEWESYGFFPLYLGDLLDGSIACAMIQLLDDYDDLSTAMTLDEISRDRRAMLWQSLTSVVIDDHDLVMRVIRLPEYVESHAPDAVIVDMWKNEEFLDVNTFVQEYRGDLEELQNALRKFAESYFQKNVEISASGLEQSLVVLFGVQNRPIDDIMEILGTTESGVVEMLREIFARIIEEFCDPS